MGEQKRPPKNRGFYVRMKFLHKNGRPHQDKPSLFYKYYKCVFWFCLSLCCFSAYLLTNHPHPHPQPQPQPQPSNIHISSSQTILASHALFESTDTWSLLKNPSTLLKNLKVFVYDLPPKYNADWLSNERCSNHLFASEVAIHRALLTSDVRTYDPFEADFFFVPVYVSCNFSTVNGFPAIGHARSLISSAVKLISSEYPFWNRSRGSDHVFVASHDFGSCFHTMEDRAIADGVPEFLKNSIILQTFGVKHEHPCQDVENVVIPPYVSPESIWKSLKSYPVGGRRDIWVFFRGKMEVHPKNISGRFYSKGVRTEIWRKYGNDRRFHLRRHRYRGYQSEISRSVFCLCPLGWAPWSPRLVESVALGCVPVIIADGVRLPFPWAVGWSEITVTVGEKDVDKLGSILEHVAQTNLTRIQRNLWDPRRREALLFSNRVQVGDATWQVLVALAQKVYRSYRSSRLSGQLASDT